MNFVNTQPLFEPLPGPDQQLFGVEIQLDNPLRGSASSTRSFLPQQLLSLLSQHEILLEKKRHDDRASPQPQWSANGTLSAIISQLEQSLQIYDSSLDIGSFIQSRSLEGHFPLTAEQFGLSVSIQKETTTDLRDYVQTVAHYNQIWSMSVQIQRDITARVHKYLAHQIALLYQSLNQIGAVSVPFKKRIEERFEEIKAALEAPNSPALTEEQCRW